MNEREGVKGVFCKLCCYSSLKGLYCFIFNLMTPTKLDAARAAIPPPYDAVSRVSSGLSG